MTDVCPQLNDADVLAARRGVLYAARRYNARLTPEDIEDLTQNAIVRFLERAQRTEPSNRTAYLSQIGRNCFVDLMRHEGAARRDFRLTLSLDGFEAPSDLNPEQECSSKEELAAVLLRCREALNPRHFRVFLLSHIHGLTGAEAARLCDTTSNNVYSILCRVRAKLALAGISLSRKDHARPSGA